MAKRRGRAAFPAKRTKQHVAGGGEIRSEKQRRWLWATHPAAARAWAHNLPSAKADWAPNAHELSVKRQTHRGRR